MLSKNAVEPATLALLKEISSKKEFEKFALAGGTNIALRKGHRLSVDLDLFTDEPYNTSLLFSHIKKSFKDCELLFEQNQTIMFIINHVKVDFILYPFKWLKSFDIIENIRFVSEDDMIPLKLQALSNRFSKKDFWDIHCLLADYSLPEMIDIFKTKFPAVDPGFIIHSLTNFENADLENNPVALNNTDWGKVKNDLSEAVKKYTETFL